VDDFCVGIGLATMVHEPSHTSNPGRVDDLHAKNRTTKYTHT
jgi:hypothetical protein